MEIVFVKSLLPPGDEFLYVFDGKDGLLKDKFKLSGRILATPLIFQNKIAVAF